MILGITPQFYPPGAGGVPQTTSPLPSLAGRMEAYTHTISNGVGFESMALTFTCTVEEGLYWMRQLMSSAIVTGPDAQTIWEGYLTQIDLTAGQETRSLALDSLFNRGRARYTTARGTPGTTSVLDAAASQAKYGVKDIVLSLGTTNSTAAYFYIANMLNRMVWPQMQPQSTISTGAQGGEIQVTLTCAGWYTTLDWLLTARTDQTTEQTTDQLKYLLTQYNATNAFFSTDQRAIVNSGLDDTRVIDADTSYRTKIEALLGQGTGSGRFAWGVYEGRVFNVALWAGVAPSIITYRRRLSDGRLTTPNGRPIDAWDVRPDAMVEVADLLDPSPQSAAQDAAARFYCERVTCQIRGETWSVQLEPTNSAALGAALAAGAQRGWKQ